MPRCLSFARLFALSYLLLASCATVTKLPDTVPLPPAPPAIKPEGAFFRTYEAFEMTLEGPFQKIFAEAIDQDSNPSFPVVVRYKNTEGQQISVPAEATVLGHAAASCPYPRLKLEIATANVTIAKEFVGANALNLSTHCHDRDAQDMVGKVDGETGPYRESFLYRIASLVDLMLPKSRPAHITYVDSLDGKSEVHNAFLSEDIDLFANRINAQVFEGDKGYYPAFLFKTLDDDQYKMSAFLKEMYGDVDSNISSNEDGEDICFLHNYEVLQDDKNRTLVIPTEFNRTSMVSGLLTQADAVIGLNSQPATPELLEAIHSSWLEKRKTTSSSPETFETLLNSFRAKKDLLMSDLAKAPLDHEGRNLIAMHLDSFFKALERYPAL